MSGKEHTPSKYRALIKESRSGKGRPLDELVKDARSFQDPYYVSLALFSLSSDERLKAEDGHTLAKEALDTVEKEKRLWRKAELLATICKNAHSREDIERQWFQDMVLKKILAFPEGKGKSDAIVGCVRYLDCERLLSLLSAAADNKGFEQETCKAVIRSWAQKCIMSGPDAEQLLDCLDKISDRVIGLKLYGYLHVQMMKSGSMETTVLDTALEHALELPGDDRQEILRYLAGQSNTLDELEAIAAVLNELNSPTEEARMFATLAGNADKAGHKDLAMDWFTSGLSLAARIEDRNDRASVRSNLATGLRRLGESEMADKTFLAALDDAGDNEKLTFKIRKAMGEVPDVKNERDSDAGPHEKRHVLALYDTYEGGLKPAHLRMVARAAPLCIAYGLDLALMNFPADDLGVFIGEVLADTNIGKGGRYLEELVKAGRVVLVPHAQSDLSGDWSNLGMPVATTSKPAKDKITSLEKALEQARASHPLKRLCLIMGLGKKGLPISLLEKVDCHVELTGGNIPLETATAMGIIARELGHVK